jgi:hypothetical protein
MESVSVCKLPLLRRRLVRAIVEVGAEARTGQAGRADADRSGLQPIIVGSGLGQPIPKRHRLQRALGSVGDPARIDGCRDNTRFEGPT